MIHLFFLLAGEGGGWLVLMSLPLPGSMQSLMDDENLRKAFQACISYGLEFAFHKKILLKNKTVKLWSQASFGWLVGWLVYVCVV